MIRRFKHPIDGDIINITPQPNGTFTYQWESGKSSGVVSRSLQDQILWYAQQGWIEVTSGFDPNDLQAQDAALWGAGSKPCCGGGIGDAQPTYGNGRWHDNNCDSLKAPYDPIVPNPYVTPSKDARPEGSKKGICTCGSAAVGSDRHSYYCDALEKK